MVERLVKFCPALPGIFYNPIKATNGSGLEKVRKLLRTHQAIVISGKNHSDFRANKRIGKTSLAFEQLIPSFEREPLTCDYFNLETQLFSYIYHNHFTIEFKLMPKKDVYAFDEIHLFFPWNHYPPALKEHIIIFWGKINRFLESGAKIIFMTAKHPLNPDYNKCEFDQNMAIFFTAPVVELASRRK